MSAFISAFTPATFSATTLFGTNVNACVAKSPAKFSAKLSQAVPYLECPPKLDGSMVGDVGFDPLGISNMYDLDFLRESELKHGRICMLAILGWVFPEVAYHLPAAAYSQTNPLYAVGSVGFLPVLQILLFIAVCEAATYKKVYDEKCANPGNYGLDMFGVMKSEIKKKHYELAEVKNGRLAMIAIGGAIHHALLTNVGMIEQITSGNWTGGYYLH